MDKREVEGNARWFVKAAKKVLEFDKAVLFGSYADGRPEEYSDIDIGLFVSRLDDNVDYLSLMSGLYHEAIEIDVRIEPHLFIRNEDRSGFAEHVEKTGIAIE